MHTMTSRERFMAALNGQSVDRLPVISVCQHATYDQMEQLNSAWPDAFHDAKLMAKLASGGQSILGFDAVRVPFCQTHEAEAFGAVLKYGGKLGLPSVDIHPYHIGDTIDFPADFLSKGRIPALLEAIRILKRDVGDQVIVMGGIIGAFSIASLLFGVTDYLKASFKKPSDLVPYIELCERAGTTLAKAMIEAGADVIVVEDMVASMDMISPKIYRTLAWEYEKDQVEALSVPTIIHICGKTDPIIVDIAKTGCAAISVETTVNIPKALENLQSEGLTTPLIGGVDPVKTLFTGQPEDVKYEVRNAIAEGLSMISPGCSVPPATRTANLRAMVDTAKEYQA
ncbi:uroporphyrinogen decarboxylase [Peptococcaceae bacterium CEB3]|nr:uroporphyrinogen decarboxylase [Peptococcaceae bacterium CEB3]